MLTDSDVLSFVRIIPLYWIGYVNRCGYTLICQNKSVELDWLC